MSAVYLSAATNIYPNAAHALLCTALMYLHLMFQQETSSVQEFWLSFLSYKIISVCLCASDAAKLFNTQKNVSGIHLMGIEEGLKTFFCCCLYSFTQIDIKSHLKCNQYNNINCKIFATLVL